MRKIERSVGSVCWFGFACALSALGCAVDVTDASSDEAAESDEVVDTAAEPLVAGWISGPYPWDQRLHRRRLASLAGNVCVLTRLTGKFEGMGEGIRVTDDGTNWYLEGFSKQRDLAAEAYCFPRDKFRGNDANTRISSEYERWTIGAPRACGWTVQSEMYASDAFAFLSGVQGALHGGAEVASVFQGLSTSELSTVESRSCADGGLSAFARNFRVGTRSERLARFEDGSRTGDANRIDEFQAGDDAPSNVVEMAKTSAAMCAFTRIQGKFAGGGEWVQIRPEIVNGEERWVLRASRAAGSNYVHARARCFSREQRTFSAASPGQGSGGFTPL